MNAAETLRFSCRPAAPHRFGPVPQESGVLFQLWAPAAESVLLRLSGSGDVALHRKAEGFWEGVFSVPVDARYCFVVDGQAVPDPASRFQPEDVHGPSQFIDSASYQWRHADWRGRRWEETVLYELHVGACGGYDGIRAQLPRLRALGITAIELMPIADFPGCRNWGYDGVFPFAPDSAYGTPDALRALIDDAHGLGMMVFLDVVYNHFGPDGNFLHMYAPEFFDQETQTPWGAAIDFSHPRVQQFYTENVFYWLEEFRFDGLRFDAVHAIKNRDWLIDIAAMVRSRITGRQIHLVLENENNDAALLEAGYDAQWNDDFHNVMHVLLTNETHSYYRDFADQPEQGLARALSEGFVYQGDPSPNHDGKPRGQPSGHLPPKSFVAFLQNHDQVGNRALGERLTTLTPKPALQAAMALLLLSPQIPLLFMGEESGVTTPFLFFTDFHGELAAQVRQGRRREFAHAPGFGEEAQQAAIPDPNHPNTYDASRPVLPGSDAGEWEALVQRLLAIRHDRIIPYLAHANARHAQPIGPRSVLASWTLSENRLLAIATNLGDGPVHADLPEGVPIFGAASQINRLPQYSTIAWITA